MSTDYGASICVGYRFSTDDALKPFAKKKGEDRFHMEDRFDPITGKKTGRAVRDLPRVNDVVRWSPPRHVAPEDWAARMCRLDLDYLAAKG